MGDHIYQNHQESRPGTIFFYLDQLKNCFDTATNIIDQCQYVMRYDSSEDSGISDSPLGSIPIVKRIEPSSLRPNFLAIHGTAEASTSRSSAYGADREPIRRRTWQSNFSVHKSVLKRRRESTLDEQSEEDSNNQILGNSVRRPKRKRFFQSKGDESTATESQNEGMVYAQSPLRYFRRQSRDSPEDSTADESQAEDMFPSTVAKSSRWTRRGIEEFTDESQDEDVFIPTIDKSMQRQRSNLEEFTADESEDDEPQFHPFSVKPVKRLRNEIQEESTADESEDEKYELKRRTSVRRRKGHFQVKSGSQNKIKIAVTRNSGISKKGRRGRPKKVNVDDTSQDETLLTELEDQQTEEESNVPNPRNLYGKSKRKLTLQNKRDEIYSQEEMSADDSQSELLKPPFSFKSSRMLRSGSQEDLTADESQNDQLGNEKPTSVKKRKRCSQIESKKSVNRNTGTSRRGRRRGKAVSASNAFHDETLIPENKKPLNKLIVKCYDILIDPSFESDPVVRKFKKDKLLHSNSPRDDEGSGKGKTYEILDEVEDQESSKNRNSEDKNPDTEDMNDSFEQTPSAPFGSDSVKIKKTAPSYISTSRRGRRGRRRALSIDYSSQDETSLNHLNAPEKEDVHPTTHELLSDIDSEKVFDTTDIEQGDKPEKELNEGEAGDVIVETESNADEIKGIDADYNDEEFKID